MAKKSNKTKVKVNVETNDKTLAIVGLILNVLVLPGLGTIVWGDTKKRSNSVSVIYNWNSFMFIINRIPNINWSLGLGINLFNR